MSRRKLRQELGDDLCMIAERLRDVAPHLSEGDKAHVAADIGFRPIKRHPVLRLSVAGAFGIFLMFVLLAQSALPGSRLYALKRGSEEALSRVSPAFEDTLEDRRRDELERLLDDRAETDRIQQAEKAYKEAMKEAEDRAKEAEKRAKEQRKDQEDQHKQEVKGRSDSSNKGSGDSDNDDDSGRRGFDGSGSGRSDSSDD